MDKSEPKIKIIVRNRKARYDFEIRGTIEAGIELKGSEVKSLRDGKANLGDAYAYIKNNEIFLRHMHISPYKMVGQSQPDPMRLRKLLLHRREIRKLFMQIQQKGITLVPLSVYFKGKVAKVELGMAVGRKQFDKRQAIAEKETKRRIDKAMRRSKD